MVTLFAAVAFLVALFSLLFTSQATAGVAGIGFACLLAIFARMGQADKQHQELLERIGRMKAGESAPSARPASTTKPSPIEPIYK